MEGVSLLAAQGVWAEILVSVPFLKIPIIGPFIAGAFFWLISFLVGKSEKFANILIIGFQVMRQLGTYADAKKALQDALQNNAGDPAAVQKASDVFDDALEGLIHNDIAGDTP